MARGNVGRKVLEMAENPDVARFLGLNKNDDNAGFVEPFSVVPWPNDLAKEAFYGLAGEVVRAISPYSEADDAAILTNFLVGFGNLVGKGPHFIAGADRHDLNLFAALVGESGKGRKGMSWAWVRNLFKIIDEEWALYRTPGGLSTGEGLIWAVRDEITKKEPIREKNKIVGYEEVVVDPGVDDKRLLIIEAEFASALKVATRQGNTLSPTIRNAWDTGVLGSMTKNSQARATGAHISIIGHVTKAELVYCLTDTEMANGFGNRFLWVCVRRSKCLPDGAAMPQQELNKLAKRVNDCIYFARKIGEMQRDEKASILWRQIYPDLSEGKPGLVGAVLGRAEAQVMRLACIYALLDLSSQVRVEHLAAALAFWERCEQSARFIFEEKTGDPVSEQILQALQDGPMAQTEIAQLFSRNISAKALKTALQSLSAQNKIVAMQQQTGGRPKTIWCLNNNYNTKKTN